MKDIAEGAMEHLDSAKRQVKSSMQSISDCADDAWNKVMGDATVRSGVETLRQAADKAWQTGTSVLAKNGRCRGAWREKYGVCWWSCCSRDC